MTDTGQAVPVRVYERDERIVVATPMPGLQPEDIGVTITQDHIVLRGEERGADRLGNELLLAEWSVGPYLRELPLPVPVHGTLANATYGNGVLVVTLPKAKHGDSGSSADFQLQSVEGAGVRGERVGHQGKEIHQTTTLEHASKKHGS